MCSIGRDQTTSIGANAPSSTLLGSTAVGGSLATGGATRIDRGRPNGTLLAGPSPQDPKPGAPRRPGGPRSPQVPYADF